jgi:hypothetical protein
VLDPFLQRYGWIIAALFFGALFLVLFWKARAGRRYRILPTPFRGTPPYTSQMLLERHRLAKTERALADLRTEREHHGYEATLSSRPGLLDHLIGKPGPGPDQFVIKRAIEDGYAVVVTPRWNFWSRARDVAFIELPELPQLPTQRASSSPVLGKVASFVRQVCWKVSFSPEVAQQVIDREAPPETVAHDVGKQRLLAHVEHLRSVGHPDDSEYQRAVDRFQDLLLDIHRGNLERPYRDKLDEAKKLVARGRKVGSGLRTHAELAAEAADELLPADTSPEEREAIVFESVKELESGARREEERREAENRK